MAAGAALVASPIVLGLLYFRQQIVDGIARERVEARNRLEISFQESFEQALSVAELQMSALAGDSDIYLASRSVLFANNGRFLMGQMRERNPLLVHIALLGESNQPTLQIGSLKKTPSCSRKGWSVVDDFALYCTSLRGYQDRPALLVGVVAMSQLLRKVQGEMKYGVEAILVSYEMHADAKRLKLLPSHGLLFSDEPSEARLSLDREMIWLGVWIGLSLVSLVLLMWWLIHLEQRRVRLEHERLRKELHALRARLNPHFLFNALNSIVNSIEVNPAHASEMVAMLSNLYRRVTHSTARDTHSLREELELVALYLDIEAMRFGERLRWSSTISPQFLDISVPTLALQLLVENAIKHGIEKSREGGGIFLSTDMISSDWARLRVVNSGAMLAESVRRGTGLTTLEKTLKMLYGERSRLTLYRNEQQETVAEILVPKGVG
jgi:hypothetical protein